MTATMRQPTKQIRRIYASEPGASLIAIASQDVVDSCTPLALIRALVILVGVITHSKAMRMTPLLLSD